MSGVDNYNWFGQSDSRSAQRNCSTVESDELCLKRSGQGVRRKENCVIVQSGYEQRRRRIHSSRFTCHALPPSFPTRATIDMCSTTLSFVQDMCTYFLQTRPVYMAPQSLVSCHERLTCVGHPFPTYRACVQSFVFTHTQHLSQPLRSFVQTQYVNWTSPLGIHPTYTTSLYDH